MRPSQAEERRASYRYHRVQAHLELAPCTSLHDTREAQCTSGKVTGPSSMVKAGPGSIDGLLGKVPAS